VALEPLSRLDVHVVGRRLLHAPKGLTDPRGITTENISQVRGGGGKHVRHVCQLYSRGTRLCIVAVHVQAYI
jgi:hypothetical protein